jgi:general secretion pathway protein F
MATFKYRALTARGEIVTGELTAPHKSEVVKRIEYLGLIPIETNDGTDGGGLASALSRDYSLADFLGAKAGADDVTTFSRDLATLLNSGVRIDQAVDLLADPEMSGALAPTVAKIRAGLTAGETFADALRQFPDLFPPVYVSLVRIGESSGSLAGVISSLAEERARVAQMRRKATDSLRYPAFILCAAGAVLLFFLLFVLPQFAVVLEDLGSRMDPIVRSMLNLSKFTLAHEQALSVFGVCLVVALFAVWRSKPARARVAASFMRLPGLKGLAADYRTAIFCRSLGVLLANGVGLTAALNLVADAVAAPGSVDKWARARERVRQGARLGDALAENGELSPIAVRMLRIGEESGHLAPVAIRAADLFEIRVERKLEKLVAIVGPAAILLIATVVGGLVVSLMTSLVSIGQLAN